MIKIEFLRFLAVGVVNTVFGYLVFLIGLALGLQPGAALAVATAIGAFFNYITTGRLVFRHTGFWRLLPFVLAYAAIYVINLAALRKLIALGLPARWAQAALLPAVAILSFLIFKYVVFFRPGIFGRRTK